MNKWGLCFVLAIVFLYKGTAHAFIEYTPNENVIDEVARESYRILPRNPHYAFAIDADFLKPAFLPCLDFAYCYADYYHGNGYWLTARAEFKPVPNITLNLKTVVTHGNSSGGLGSFALIYPLVGVTLEKDIFGLHWETRLSEIGRQTVGSGLFIEQKETDGGYLLIRRDFVQYKLMVDGTGSYNVNGGVIAMELSFWKGLLGITSMFNEVDPAFNPPMYIGTIYSKYNPDEGLGYAAEIGGDKYNWASMAYLQYRQTWNKFRMWLKPQFRHYGSDVVGQLAKHVNTTYMSYDQNDKPYTNLQDIFAMGDSVNTYSTELNADFRVSSFYSFFAETEAIYFDYLNASPFKSFFYRTGIKFHPIRDRDEEVGVQIGNKYLIASEGGFGGRRFSPPTEIDGENKPLFMRQLYLMIDFSTRF